MAITSGGGDAGHRIAGTAQDESASSDNSMKGMGATIDLDQRDILDQESGGYGIRSAEWIQEPLNARVPARVTGRARACNDVRGEPLHSRMRNTTVGRLGDFLEASLRNRSISTEERTSPAITVALVGAVSREQPYQWKNDGAIRMPKALVY